MGKPAGTFVVERFALEINAASIDAVNGVIEDVRVCGPKSRNGRKYPPAVTAKFLALYAAPVNVGHHFDPTTRMPIEVPPLDRFGRITDPKAKSDGVNGKLRFNPEHAFAKPFVWACKNDPAQYSFSPLKRVKWSSALDADGDQVAESILEVASIDIVSDGGTTSTIFESATPGASVMTVDPMAIAAELATADDLTTFLTQLFANLSTVDAAGKQSALDAVMSAIQAAPGDGAAAIPAAMESLRRSGKVGRWAAAKLNGYFTAESARYRKEWAASLIETEQLPTNLRSDLFIELVAESHGNPDRAKALINELKQIAGAGKVFDPPAGGGGGAKSVKDIVAGYVVG